MSSKIREIMHTAGLYLHVPFCKSRCSYCDFATDVWRSDDAVERYVTALTDEIRRSFDSATEKRRIDTIYLGGGTPSLLSPAQLSRVMETVRNTFDVSNDAEITLEMNPGTVTAEKLNEFRSIGVNRASFGVQTFDDRALKLLARGHDSNDARRTFELLQNNGFDNISFDLIAGLPGQSVDDWDRNLREALALNPSHLSLYLLEVHEGTPLAGQLRGGRRSLPADEEAAEMYELLLEKTAEAGLTQYEISNFAVPGRESRHNLKYWLCAPVFAAGVSAHSFDGRTRRANHRDTAEYVKLVGAGDSPIVWEEELSPSQLASEVAFLGLRLNAGLNLAEYQARFGIDLMKEKSTELEPLFDAGLLEMADDLLRLTPKGMVFSNEVFAVFI